MIERQGILEQVQSDINKLLLNLKTGKYLWKAAQRISVSDSGLKKPKTDSVFAISTATAVLQAPTNGTIFQLSVNNAGTVF